MRRLAASAVALGALLAPAPGLPAAGERLVDRIVAVVDDGPIYLSDIRRVIGLGLAAAAPEETALELERRVLDGLIDQRVRFHQVERYSFGPLPAGEIDRRLEEIRGRFSDQAAFAAHLSDLGLTEDGLRYLLSRQLRILIYIEERLGPRVFVHLEDIRAYYESKLSRQAAAGDMELPPLAEVREEIRSLLREIRLNEEIEAWTEELRLKAEIVDHLDRLERELPPVVRRLGAARE